MSANLRSRAFWCVGAGAGEIREAHLSAPGAGELLVRASCSGISRGTDPIVPTVPGFVSEIVVPSKSAIVSLLSRARFTKSK